MRRTKNGDGRSAAGSRVMAGDYKCTGGNKVTQSTARRDRQ
jgi:hypothetical protein